ncbi:protein rep [Nitrosovibrio sp. Nv4]|uniref:protein rep n=1 Tax=Nitrosovibrio sp. Nv4 TaxID=1945880 RepID=UPI000BC4BF57|nr:protein rep [Nitrosovibrio sp. Nv4]SOD41618.1 hypothetical protein SAMN06298226_1920 [Nitrosovibrio sp. Nv4]
MSAEIDFYAKYPPSKPAVPNILGSKAKSLHSKDNIRDLQSFITSKKIRQGLQRVAAGLLWERTGNPKQKYRVVHCGRSIAGDGVAVYRAADGTRARLSGLTTCGSGWMCPVCAQNIAEARRKEASKAMVQHIQGGGQAHLVTLTFSHHADEPLPEMLKKFDDARQSFKNCVTWKTILGKKDGKEGEAGCIGAITALEVTYGIANGWHPHVHMVVLTKKEVTAFQQERLKCEWVRILLKKGLSDRSQVTDLMERAFDMRGGADAADYITKYGREEHWGLTSELVRAHSKQGLMDGRYKPFGLLQLAGEGNAWAAERFKEFAVAFHGKRLLTWSPGLKKAFDLQEIDDAELSDDALPVEERVGRLTPEQWKVVLDRDARADLLMYAAGYCAAGEQQSLDEYIEHLSKRPKTSRGWFIQKPDGCEPWVYH